MADPHRGQLLPFVAQVVPQLEQVLIRAAGPVAILIPLVPAGQMGVPAPGPVLHTSVKAQEDWGNRGREKNSSQTDSANSSQGGISQKP